jgi:hypothetical protein
MVTIGITVMVLSLSVLGLNSNSVSAGAMAQNVANEVRLARAAAVTRGAHYRIVLGADWYTTERLQDEDDDKVWTLDTTAPTKRRELIGGVTMTASTGNTSETAAGTASIIEFDTRGMVVAGSGTIPPMMTVAVVGSDADNAIGGTSYVYVWPSGQVELLQGDEVHP